MISTKSDAKVESVDIYDRIDIPVEELNWSFTGEETRAYRGEFFLPFSEKELNYWKKQSERWFESARSTAARNSLHFWIDDWEMEENGMRGSFEGRSLQNYIDIEEEDEIFRILMYKEDDQLTAPEVNSRIDEITKDGRYRVGENALIDNNTLEIPIDRRLELSFTDNFFDELDGNKNQNIQKHEQKYEGGGDFGKFELLKSAPISMPEDIFGRIKDTSIKGHTYHLNSVAVDPDYEGGVVAEVAIPDTKNPEYPPGWDEQQYLEMELYEATESIK